MAHRVFRRSPVQRAGVELKVKKGGTKILRVRVVVWLCQTNAKHMKQFIHALQSREGGVIFNVVDELHGAATLEGYGPAIAYLIHHPAVLRWEWAMSIRIPFSGTGTTDEDEAAKAKKKEIREGMPRGRKKGVDQRPNERKRK